MLSVVVPTRDRADALCAAMESLTQQTLPRDQFEVLVVDNGSTDSTPALVRIKSAQLENLRYLLEPEPGLHAGRHRGMREAKGDVLVFADDDIEALPSWLASIKEAFSDPDVALVGGNDLPNFLAPPPQWLLRVWEREQANGARSFPPLSIQEHRPGVREIDPLAIWGCNFAIRKEVLLEAGGFHPDSMPWDLIRFRGDGESHVSRFVARKGLRSVFHSGASVFHAVPPQRMTSAYFRQRGFNQGVSDSYTNLRGEDRHLDGQRRLIYRLARWGYGNFRSAAESLRLGMDAGRALQALQTGHREGYAFHQSVYQADPEVREWVHRERYF